MKKFVFGTIIALSLSSAAAVSAHAHDAGFNYANEAGVKVYRGAATHINHQAVASYKALDLRETQIKNQNQQARAKLQSQNSIAQQRIDLDRRIAFTDNEIFSQNRSRFGGRGFSSRGFRGGSTRGFNRGFNSGISNRFFGVNGISNNSRFSGGFSGGSSAIGTSAVRRSAFRSSSIY